MRILLDPGHGGDKPGAVYDGTREADITLAVSLRCCNVLRNLGHDVFLTRDRDTGIGLVQRVRMMNEYKAQVFLSIHCNASPDGERPHGCETYYRDDNDEQLAMCVQGMFTTYSGRKDAGIHQDEMRLKKRLTVLNNLELPCALVELGYLSNDEDRAYLTENISTAGELLAHGIDWYTYIKSGTQKTLWPA